MNILITGSNGFIGGHVVKEMSRRGHRITTFDRFRNTSPLVDNALSGDVRNKDTVSDGVNGNALVIHTAAVLGTQELIEKPHLALDVNTGGTINVLNGCRQHGARLLFVSKPNKWLNTYSITKAAADQFCEMYSREFGLAVQVARPFNVYGPGESVGPGRVVKAIPTMITNALTGLPLSVNGSGNQTNDFVHVSDVARVLADLSEINADGYQDYEIGTGVERSVNELCQLILQFTRSKSEIEHMPARIGETPDDRVFADVSALEQAIGPQSLLDLEEGLPETITHYRNLLGLT